MYTNLDPTTSRKAHYIFVKKPAHYKCLVNKPIFFSFLLLVGWDLVPCTAAISGLLCQPQMIGEGDYGAIGGMKIGGGNRSTRRKPAPAPLCPPKIPLDKTPRSNPGRSGGKPPTNRLSYGAAKPILTLKIKETNELNQWAES
jgi:hypothetical protein